jgi:hypothetical protein
MDARYPRTPRSLADLDLGGLACFVLALWGLAVVVRGAAMASCPGCESATTGRALVVTGTLLLAVSSIVVWTRGSRVAASVIAAPGLIVSVALVAVPGVPLHLLGLALVPWAIAAARGAVRDARPLEITAAIWVFGLTAVVGAAGTGLAAAAAAGGVVACALATPELLVLHLPSVPDVVPDDLI